MKPHYEVYKKHLEEKDKKQKSDNEINKQIQNFKIKDCSNIIKNKYSKKTKIIQDELLNKCKIWFIIKSKDSCNVLWDSNSIDKCNKIKKDVLEYENFMKKEQNYDDYGDFNMKLFIEWRDSDFWNNLIPSF